MSLSPEGREAMIAIQRQSMQYGEVVYESGTFEPGRITGWFGTVNMAKPRPGTELDRPGGFGPPRERPQPIPSVVVIQDVDTPASEQQARIIPLPRVLYVDQAASS